MILRNRTRYAAFDIGNVLCDVTFDSFFAKIKTHLSHTIDGWEFISSFQREHDLGLSTIKKEIHKVYYGSSAAMYHTYDVASKVLLDEWNNGIVSFNPVMKQFIKGLLDKHVRVALLSNIGFEHAELMPSILGKDVFDACSKHFSCEVGARKPTKLYYQSFLMEYPEFSGCAYADDRPENIVMAKRLGFKGVDFDISNKTHEQIKQLCTDMDVII